MGEVVNDFDFYMVRAGDQLYKIMRRHYGDSIFLNNQKALLADVISQNGNITDPDLIFPGQTIALPVRSTHASRNDSKPISQAVITQMANTCQALNTCDPLALQFANTLNSMANQTNLVGGSFSGLQAAGQNAATQYAASSAKVTDLYKQYKSGRLSKHHYYKNRSLILNATDKSQSILRQRFSPPTPTTRLLRMSANEVRRTTNINRIIAPYEKLAARAKIGGGILTLATVGVSAVRYSNAETPSEKTVIVTETVGSLAGGIAGAAVGTMVVAALVSNPAGWVVLVGVAVGSVAGSMTGGASGNALGNAMGERFFESLDNSCLLAP